MKRLSILFSLFILLSPMSADALVISPMRVIFSGKQRSAEVYLSNNGKAPASYRISLVNKRMKRDSTYEDVPYAISLTGERFADKLLKFSPKQVTLQPGETQTIRLLLRKPSKIAPGEYRSYLQMLQIPTAESLKPAKRSKKKLDIQLTANFGYSIPIIVRHGKTAATVSITTAKFTHDPKNMNKGSVFVTLTRSGNQSVYGPMHVTYKPNNGLEEFQVGIVNNMAVPTPNTIRDYTLKLTFPDKSRPPRGTLKIVYTEGESGALGEPGSILAEKVLQIP